MGLLQRTGVNLVYKLLVFPGVIYGFSRLFPGLVFFHTFWPVLIISGLFIAIGLVADETILPRLGNLPATAQGFLFMAAVIWGSQYLFDPSRVTIPGSFLLALLLGIAEYVMHAWILKQRALAK
jgi:hypothetical protein